MYHENYETAVILALKGKTLKYATLGLCDDDGDFIDFETNEGEKFRMCHIQDCCESVTIEDICGDLKDLECKIIDASEVSNSKSNPDEYFRETWTFYQIQSEKGNVTIRWYGSSNGYYSERADFFKVL